MAVKVLINGMGVLGREMLRQLWGKEGIEIVALNDLVPATNLAYLLKYDSIYHGWTDMINNISATENGIEVEAREIRLYSEEYVENLPLGELDIDVAIDCSGLYSSTEKMQAFLKAGVKKVISCDYCGNDLPTIAYGVNHQTLTPDKKFISCPSMELQVAALVFQTLKPEEIYGAIAKAYRPFTNAQFVLDNYNTKNFVGGRSAAANIAPMTDKFAKSVGLVIPELNGKIIGFAYRSPVTNGSVLDFTVYMKKNYSIQEINATLKAACNHNIEYTYDALCSSDAMSFAAPQILSQSTTVLNIEGVTLVNISVVYDNIRGHCRAVKGVIEYLSELY